MHSFFFGVSCSGWLSMHAMSGRAKDFQSCQIGRFGWLILCIEGCRERDAECQIQFNARSHITYSIIIPNPTHHSI